MRRTSAEAAAYVGLLLIAGACEEPRTHQDGQASPSAQTDPGTARRAVPAGGPPTPAPAERRESLDDPRHASLRRTFIAAKQAEATPEYFAKAARSETKPWQPLQRLQDGRTVYLRALNPARRMFAEFTEDGVRVAKSTEKVSGDVGRIGLRLARWGREGTLQETEPLGPPSANDNKVEYDHSAGLTEWYLNGPHGLEQGFTIAERPAGEGKLVFEVALGGEGITPRMTARGDAVELVGGPGVSVGRYGDLFVEGAGGEPVAATMRVVEGGVRIVVEDAEAVYPLVIDPTVWLLDAKLTAGSGGDADDRLGASVSVSGDTALIGAPLDDNDGTDSGAAYVFVRNVSGTWTKQQKLTAGTDGAANDQFGSSVSVSGDTALIGARLDDDDGAESGSAYVFARNVSGTWTKQQKLTAGTDGAANDQFGSSVSVSEDTALIGAPWDDGVGPNSGSAYVFVRDADGTWTKQQKLTAGTDGAVGDSFGSSVSLSGDTALIGASASAYVFVRAGSTWSKQQKLTAGTDGAANDGFGSSVSLSGDTVLIGAPYDDDDGAGSGSAYVFVRAGSTWSKQQKLTAGTDGAANDSFGSSVSFSGDTALVGARRPFSPQSGSAYVFVRDANGTWSKQQKLTAGSVAANDSFGFSVSLSGDTALIGAYGDGDDGGGSGSAYVFVRGGSAWSKQQKIAAGTDGAANAFFGTSVSLAGDTALIGASGDDDDGGGSGSAYVFVRDAGGSWSKQQKIAAGTDGAVGDGFGSSVSVAGDTALIGAPRDDDDFGFYDFGSAYVFVRDAGGSWSEQQKIAAGTGGRQSDFFGTSVSLAGDTALIGAFGDDDYGSDSGAAYVFVRDAGGSWSEQQKISAETDGASEDRFGLSVSVSGDTALIGAPYNDDDGQDSGSAYVFVRAGSTWSKQQKLTAGTDGAANDSFGSSVSVSGDTALIGASGDDDDGGGSGSAYVFVRAGSTWSKQQKISAGTDGAVGDSFGSSVSLSGNTALIGAAGSAYVFVRAGSTWSKQQKLTPGADGAAGGFGSSVSLSGDTALIGARYDSGDGQDSGSAYVFESAEQAANGGVCWEDRQCSNGHCTDHICCDETCSGPCESCWAAAKADGSADGTCGLVVEGSRCGPDPTACASATEYAIAPTCNAAGACGENKASCANGFACFATSASRGFCAWDCAAFGTRDHALCADTHWCMTDPLDGARGVCEPDKPGGSSCSEDAECIGGLCASNNCKKFKGETCGQDLDCASGLFCRDGYCCDTACGEQCAACDVAGSEGTCTAVTGVPHGARAACAGSHADCVGQCDGQRVDGCSFPDLTQTCGAPFCEGGVFTNQVCNGQGGCVDATPERCAPYGCNTDRTACAAACTSNSDCATGAACNSDTSQCAFTDDTCVDAFTSESSSGVRTDCSPYRCAAGVCQEQCERDGDCVDGHVCESRDCVRESDPSSDEPGGEASSDDPSAARSDAGETTEDSDNKSDGGCGCSVPGAERSGAGRLSLLALAALLLPMRSPRPRLKKRRV